MRPSERQSEDPVTPTPVSLRRVGPLLFSNVVWVHPHNDVIDQVMTGKGHLDAKDGLVKAHTVATYAALESELADLGLGLQHVVHQRVRLRDLRDYPTWLRTARATAGAIRAATSLHGEGDGLPPGIDVALEVVVSADADAEISIVSPADAEAASDPFPPAVRCGQFVFTSTLNPTTPSGEVVTEFGQLQHHADAGAFPEFAQLGAQGWLEERHAAQMLATYEHVDRILRAVNSDVDGLLKHNGFVRMPMKAYTAMEAARRYFFGDRKAPPATTVQVHDLGISPAVDLAFDVVALAGGPLRREEVDLSSLTAPYGFYLLAARAGKVMFTAGELPYVKRLGGDPRGGAVGTWDEDPGHGLAAQTRDVVSRLAEILELAGPGPSGLRRLGLALRDRRHLEAWTRLALAELPGADPLVVETVVLDAGPYPTCLFELDAVVELD
jgi:enamine deaminase RidA (YjgF/YER057c/UK114 family)